jgi:hypothetical protein
MYNANSTSKRIHLMNKKTLLLAASMAFITTLPGIANAENWKDALNAVKEKTKGQSLNSITQKLQTNPQVGNVAQTIKSGGLTELLMTRVGVTQAQAEGGAGALFQVAKSKMKPDSFAQLEQNVPGMQTLLGAAPAINQASGLGGLAGGLSSLAGNSGGGTTGNLLAAAAAFQLQGMSPAMIQQFVPVVIEYVKSKSGGDLANTLSSALIKP